jgi:hypothetical protein
MQTLSQDFLRRAAVSNSRKVLVAFLYYTDTEYLPLATAPCVIGTKQCLGVLSSIDGSTSKWNWQDNNNVTISTPTISISAYSSPEGFDIMNFFNTYNLSGRRIVIRMGYEFQEKEDMLLILEGTVDEVDFIDSQIQLTLRSKEFSDKIINGRRLNYATSPSDIGGTVTAYTQIPSEQDGKYLPVPFGNQWNAPAVLYNISPQDGRRHYCFLDDTYGSGTTTSGQTALNLTYSGNTYYKYNLNKNTPVVYVYDSKFYVPYYNKNFAGGWTYTGMLSNYGAIPEILIANYSTENTYNGDDMFLVETPLRFKHLTSYTAYASGATFSSNSGTPLEMFNTSGNAVDGEINIASPITSGLFIFNTELDIYKNLRTDSRGVICAGQPISVQEKNEIQALTNCLYGMAWTGNILNTLDIKVLNWVYTPSFDFYYIPQPNSTTWAHYGPPYVGGCHITAGAGDLSAFNKMSYCYYNGTYNTPNYVDPENENDLTILREEARFGVYEGSYPAMGDAPDILRTALHNKYQIPVWNRWEFRITRGTGVTGSQSIYITDLYSSVWGGLDVKKDDNLYMPLRGLHITNTSGLNSTKSLAYQTNFQLQRPYEYLELILKTADNTLSFTSSWSGLATQWNNLFGTFRDKSGFTLLEETKLSDFMREYTKYEPYTVYINEQNQWSATCLQTTYSASDIVGTLDFVESTDFKMSMTPLDKVVCEIKSLKTDFIYGDTSYAQDIGWKVASGTYDYSTYKNGNTYVNNSLFIDEIKKQYTSYAEPDIVTSGGNYYSCIRTASGQTVPDYVNYLTSGLVYYRPNYVATSGLTWSSSTIFKGIDSESYSLAKYYLNQNANRHRWIKYTTNNLSYAKYNIGDIVGVANCPYSLLGMTISGFNNATNFTSSINNQTVYAAFVITAVKKSINEIYIEATQLHKLNDYEIVRVTAGDI